MVKLHSSATYHVYMLGFMPGFSYLGDVPQRLQLPRRATPRSSVPAGSLAIAMQMTSIYPLSSPGGWHLIGECPVPFFRLTPNPATLLFPGDKVKFESVTLAEHRSLLERATRGSLQIHPVVIQDNRAA